MTYIRFEWENRGDMMSLDQVNQLFEEIHVFSIPTFCIIISIVLIGSLIIGTILTKSLHEGAMIMVFVCLVFIPITQLYTMSKEKPKIEKWEQTVKKEYIEKLPVHSVSITSFRQVDTASDISFFTKENKDAKTMELEGIDEGIPFKKTLNVQVERTDEKQAYMTYQYVEDNLPFDRVAKNFGSRKYFSKGYYNAVLYVPKSS